MDEHGSPLAVVAALGLVGLVVLLVASLRWALPGRWVVVMRSGVVRRVRERGPVATLPLVEQARVVDGEPFEETVTARGRTADGEEVRLVAAAHARATPPALGEEYADPAHVVVDVVEPALAERIGRYGLDELVAGIERDLPGLVPGLDAEARAGGVHLLDVRAFAVEHLLLSPSVPHQCERPPGQDVAVR